MADRKVSSQRSCPVCGGLQRSLLFRRDEHEVVRCADCSMVFLAGELAPATEGQKYNWNTDYLRERARREREYPVLIFLSGLTRRLKPDLAERLLAQTLRWKQSGKLLDLGCADGEFLLKAALHFKVTGVEISHELVERARKRLPAAEILLGAVTQVSLPESTFDVVTQFSFLEHEYRPLGALHAVQRTLKPGGVTVIKVPNHASWNRRLLGQAWSGYRLPDHCNYFTPGTLCRMLIKAGLKPLRRSWLDRPPTSDSLWLAAQKPA